MNRFFLVICVLFTIVLLTFVNSDLRADTNVIAQYDDSPSLAIGTALTIYETVVRIVPTKSNNSILNFIFKCLHEISEFLNVKKE